VTAAYPFMVTLADLDLQLFESSPVCSCGFSALQTSNFCSCRDKREQLNELGGIKRTAAIASHRPVYKDAEDGYN